MIGFQLLDADQVLTIIAADQIGQGIKILSHSNTASR
jgi:hypothetical protein